MTDALQAVIDHHDMLRARLVEGELEVRPAGAPRAADCLRRGTDDPAGRLDPAGGMIQATWLDAGPEKPGRLHLTVHHLAVDGVSWRILAADLAAAWAGAPLEPVPASFRGWALALHDEGGRGARRGELPLWRRQVAGPRRRLGRRPLDPARDVVGRAGALRLRLEPAAAEAVLGPAPAALDATVHEALLAALAVAVEEWCWRRGRDEGAVVIDVEGHGREGGRDLSRTVGWFTSLHPLRLDLGGLDAAEALAGGRALRLAVRRVRDELRGLPDRGAGFGVLRYLDPVAGPELAGFDAPELGFNYLGRLVEAGGLAGGADPDLPLPHTLEVNALAAPDGLTAIWTWAPEVFDAHDVEALAEGWFRALRALAPAAETEAGDDDVEDLLRRWEAGA